MKKTVYLYTAGLIGFGLILVISCSSTRSTSVWRDDSYPGIRADTIMLAARTNSLRDRHLLEEAFAKKFQANGIIAVKSVALHPEAGQQDHADLITAARKRNIPLLLEISLKGVETRTVYHPPRPVYRPIDYYDSYPRYRYPSYFGWARDPGFYTQHQYVKVETDIYDARTNVLVWSVASETADPETVNYLADALSDHIIDELYRNTELLYKEK